MSLRSCGLQFPRPLRGPHLIVMPGLVPAMTWMGQWPLAVHMRSAVFPRCCDRRLDRRDAVDRADVADEPQQVGHGEVAGRCRRQRRLPVLAFQPEIRLTIAVDEADK